MSNPRQPAFYANFFRAVRSCEPTTYRSLRSPPPTSARNRARSTGLRSQSTYQNRYGPAATEGLPPPPKPKDQESKQAESSPAEPRPKENEVEVKTDSGEKKAKQAAPVPEQHIEGQKAEESRPAENETEHENEKEDKEPITIDVKPKSQTVADQFQESGGSKPSTDFDIAHEASSPTRELDMVLSIPSPNELKGKASRHPHLEPSPYEHHFDTYSLVQDLASPDTKAFSEHQSVTLMKAIRLMLQNNLDIAKEGLVSKSDIENESYLFRAACSELRTTLQSSRFAENQRQRSNRAQLQHEFDILNQKVNQDVLNMREELKGLFNDRKMGLQDEKRKVDSQISGLNYQITVSLNSDAKSDVEGLRWVLTRRAALAIVAAAFMTLSALQYYSIKSREAAEVEKKRQAAAKAQEERIKETESARYTTPSRNSGTQTEGLLEETLG